MTAARRFAHLDDFLAWEARQPERWEYNDGVARMRIGASLRHSWICGNFHQALRRLLPSSCKVFAENAQLRLGDSVFYPDLLVTCGEIDLRRHSLDHASLLIEVESPSGGRADHRRKLLRYQQTPGLAAYWIFAQHAPEATLHAHRDDGLWTIEVLVGMDAVAACPALGLAIPFTEIYADVPFDLEPPEAE